MNIQFILTHLKSIVIESNLDANVEVNGFSIDTRNIKPGQIFVAMKGENTHGNTFAQSALNQGAACIITDISLSSNQPHILVKNTLDAFTALAEAYRKTLTAQVVAVTGSVGKTSVKEGLKYILSCLEYKVHASVKSYNNHIGVPLTILNCPTNAQFLILEMGMNSPGEIKALTQLGKPNIAVVTAVGPGHIEFFKSVEDIAKEKVSICEGVCTNGIAILPFDSEFFSLLKQTAAANKNIEMIVSFGGNQGADICNVAWEICNEALAKVKVQIQQKSISYTLPSINKSWLNNSLVILAILHALNIDLKKVPDLLGSLPAVEGRGAIHKLDHNGVPFSLIDDAYNANPISMSAALETLSKFSKSRKIAVLGDMRELGSFTSAYHKEIGQLCNKLKIDKVITCGNSSLDIFNELSDSQKLAHCNSYEKVLGALLPGLSSNDVVLIKASNGVKLHQVVSQLKALV